MPIACSLTPSVGQVESAAMSDRPMPAGLRLWFVAHFVADMVFAIPLFFFPEFLLHLFGWVHVDGALARIAAAALFGIGIQSLLGKDEGPEVFRAMLTLKVIWSSTATVGIAWAAAAGTAPQAAWLFAGVFGVFCVVWTRYRILLGKPRAALGPAT